MDIKRQTKILCVFAAIFMAGLTTNLYAQNKTVTGTVLDAQSMKPLAGVNILVVGTSSGAATDANGHYNLSVPSLQDTLRFSFIGYKTKNVPINGRTTVNVNMVSKIFSGQQLVVVGYTKKKRENVTGAVSQVSGKSITETPVTNTTQALEGKVPGVVINDRGGEPGNNNASFLIRGKATLGDNSPLFVIDGVPRSEDAFSDLSPNDIKSVSILKGASAAIYGARAANGVVLVTTKKGHPGKPTVSLHSSGGIQTFTSYPQAMTSYQRAKYFNEWYQYEGLQPLYTKEELQHFKLGDEPLQYPNTNWENLVLADRAPQTHQNLSIQGGSDNTQYYISGDYLYQQGMFKSNSLNYNRYQLRARVNSNITDNLTVGMNLMGRSGKRHTPETSDSRIWQGILYDYPWIVARWPNGSLGPGMDTGNSPLTATNDKYGYDNINRYIFNSKFSVTYEMPWLARGLELSGYANFNFRKESNKNFSDVWTAYTYDVKSKKYTPKIGHSRDARVFGTTSSLRELETQNSFDKTQFYHLQLSYVHSFGQHNINAFVAVEQSESTNDYLSGFRKGLPSDKKVYLFAGQPLGKDNNGYATLGGRVNYFGDISYNYANTYLLDFSLRDDGSFNFPKGHRFGLFPAVSGGWNITSEPFMDGKANWLNQLKLRASWGKMGNDRVPAFQYVTRYEYGGSGNYYAFGTNPQAQQTMAVQNVANPNITWEVAYKTDIGIDLSALRNTLDFTFDVYSGRRRRILIHRNASVPDYTALSLPDENLGKVNNKGLELSLNYQNTIGNIGYNIGGNMTYHKSEILYMDEAKNIPDYQRQEGHPIHSWLVYKADGLWQSQSEIDSSPHLPGTIPGDIRYIDVNGDGEITGNDEIRKYTSPIPKIQYGFNLGLNYKNVGVNIFFQGQAKAQQLTFYDEGIHLIPQYFTERWTPQNRDAKLPRAFSRDDAHNVRPSTFWLYNASFLRLKTARIYYNLPASLLTNIGVSQLEVYVSGQNLVTWDHMLGNWDPEREGGGDAYHYPQIATYLVGLNIKF